MSGNKCPHCTEKTYELAYYDDDMNGYHQVDGFFCIDCGVIE